MSDHFSESIAEYATLVWLEALRYAVLLVDDMVDSRWTLTVAAWLLRSHGSGEMLPLALALAGHDE